MLHRLTLQCRSFKTTFSTCAVLLRPRNGALTGSAKLFADAAKEEAESEATGPQRVPTKPDDLNWTGDERLEDTVLRMLVDKYKPLRTGTIQTAEQKLRKSPARVQEYHPDPSPTPSPSPVNGPSPGSSWADVPLLAGSADHRPWHTEFKVPEHAKSSIKFGHFPLPSHTARATHTGDLEQSRKTEKEFNKTLGRIIGARESTLDYRLGLGPHAKRTGPRVNPVNMKGWTSLIEDRIEQARRAGFFASVKGRGKPITRAPEESNPFIGREEFLMNRIVRRNGAAPPWVQLQAELDAALATFRALLHAGWTRHAVRAITLHGVRAGEDDAALRGFRDPAWARREAAYHATALAEVNERVRQYNALAPYAVRRPLYVLEAELAGTYDRAGEDVARAVAERAAKENLRAAVDGHPDRRPAGRYDWSWLRRVGEVLLAVGRRLARPVRLGTR
ncbi:hypothetical protein DFH08DRAFT_784815 [Mycena albidolilacea]|uniref:DnaJ homologue subfamily C member 28 conserved domain-containing protein n=1 Tax=Mycena albidolilacea TaxID=1033008 RepID=A0AAD6ZR22_9AGAR|nr:hypothetical protein DFH08DRAFT_784815 [Mycena albidolilacea]